MPRPVITTRLSSHHIPNPPSTSSTSPVMNEASSEARKRTAPAISSGSATRAERRVLDHRRGRLFRQHLGELRLHVAGRDDVRADVPRAELARERLREADDPGLRGRVVRLAPVAVHADDRADVDDRPAALLHHRPRHRAAGVEDRAQIRVDHRAPVVVRHAREQAVARQPRVVDEHVDVAGLVDEPLRVLGRRDVGLDRPGAELRRELLGLVLAGPVADDDVGAGGGEPGRDRAADPARGAGDERELSFEGGELGAASQVRW